MTDIIPNGTGRAVRTNINTEFNSVLGNTSANANAVNAEKQRALAAEALITASIPTVPDNITTQGNTFNGANELVQLDNNGKLPAIDGSQLTGINSSNFKTLTVDVGISNTSSTTSIPVGAIVTSVSTNIVSAYSVPSTVSFSSPVSIPSQYAFRNLIQLTNGNILGVDLVGVAYTSSDSNGTTWNSGVRVSNTSQVINGLCQLANGNILTTDRYGNVYQSIDNGNTWSNISVINTGFTFNFIISMCTLSNGWILAGGDNNDISTSKDGGLTWTTSIINNGVAWANIVGMVQLSNGWVVLAPYADNHAWISQDNGLSWTAGGSMGAEQPYVFCKYNDILYCMSSISLLISTDYGNTWSVVVSVTQNEANEGEGEPRSMCSLSNGDLLLSGWGDIVYTTINTNITNPTLEVLVNGSTPTVIQSISQNNPSTTGTYTTSQNTTIEYEGVVEVVVSGSPISGSASVVVEYATGDTSTILNDLNNYLPLSGGTMTGTLELKTYTETINNQGSTSGSANVDWSTGSVQEMTLNGNTTLSFINAIAGESITLLITQDSTGSRTCSFSNVRWAGGTAPTLSTTANATDIFVIIYNGTSFFGFTGGLGF